ncbi:hypothetical protein DCCM_3498 [Desulfocucumis palustris]|uniref:Uncharacterized protein n=2 Tax=Desulfocucumis palustris TaxID=1898651 RepID=A0A2L2XDT5_9FIRM|nr:hypothetical protein DCCM_3498 [Desulfocucumis palustris]
MASMGKEQAKVNYFHGDGKNIYKFILESGDYVDIDRARKILNTRGTVEVFRNGLPVWIEGVDEVNNTASVRPLNGPGMVSEVPVAELVEG